jgi:ubiquitin carboxyl-terminal hydrolase 7
VSPETLLHPTDLKVLAEGYYEWKITDYSQLVLDKKLLSPSFKVGEDLWNLLIIPKANDNISFYLNYNDPKRANNPNWSICAQFSLVLRNPTDDTIYYHRELHHRFVEDTCDWGFPTFHRLTTDLINGKPIMEEDSFIALVFIRIINDESGILWSPLINWDSKKETGYVGLKNQGATCYMNSLLQTLFFTNYLRKAVFNIPVLDSDDLSKSVPYALQKIFYHLQNSEDAVGIYYSITLFRNHRINQILWMGQIGLVYATRHSRVQSCLAG